MAVAELVKGDGLPLYRKVRDLLKEQLNHGVWKAGDMLPTETELSERFGVSPGTVRQAVLLLVREGLVTRRSGKGTFVAPLESSHEFARFFRFRDGDSGQAFEPEFRVIDVAILPMPPAEVLKHLGLGPKAHVLCLRRLLTHDGMPLCLYTSYLPYRAVRGLEKVKLDEDRLYKILEHRLGIHVVRAEELLRATAASPEDAALLNLNHGDPVILIERTAYTHQNSVIEWRRSISRGDAFFYKVRLP